VFPWDDLRKIFVERSQMAKVLNGVTDDRQTTDDRLQTDGLVIAHSEREFTFAKKPS